MQALVVFDSAYGNTAKVARAISGTLGGAMLQVGAVDGEHLGAIDLLVVGSPTQGGKPTAAMSGFLQRIPPHALAGIAVAAFDTRIRGERRGPALRLLMRLIGYAAPRIGHSLEAKGGSAVAGPEGFYVDGKEGPLADGEIERAVAWAGGLQRAAAAIAAHQMPTT